VVKTIRSRILILVSILLAMTILSSLLVTTILINRSTEDSIEGSIDRITQVVQSTFHAEMYKLSREAKLISALPVLRSVIETNDIATIKDSTQDYQKELNLPVFYVFNKKGELLVNAGKEIANHTPNYWLPILTQSGLTFIDKKLVLYAVSKVGIGGNNSGFIMIGSYLDDQFIQHIKKLTDASIIISLNNRMIGLNDDQFNFDKIKEIQKSFSENEKENLFKEGTFVFKLIPFSKVIDKLSGIITIKLSLSSIKEVRNRILTTVSLMGLIIFLLASVAGAVVSSSLSKPIVDLTQISRRVIETNDLSLRAKEESKDEVSILAKVFNELLSQLKDKQDELKNYNLNLEEKVKERTLQISQILENLETLLNNLDEGYFVFSADGIIMPGASLICNELFLTDPIGKPFVEVIGKFTDGNDNLQEWIKLIFKGTANFEALAEIGLKEIWHKDKSKFITLEYRPIYQMGTSKTYLVDKVICIAKDRTEEQRLRTELENDSAKMEMVLAITKHPEEFKNFLKLIFEKIEYHKAYLKSPVKNVYDQLYASILKRDLHTLKGGSSTFYLSKVVTKIHQTEEFLHNFEKKEFLENANEILNHLNLVVDELNGFIQQYDYLLPEGTKSGEETTKLAKKSILDFKDTLTLSLGKKSPLYEKYVEVFYLSDITKSMQKFHLTIQQVSRKYEKKASLYIFPSNILIYLPPYHGFIDSLVHVFSNAIAHGIEDPESRQMNQKNEMGIIEVSANYFENMINLTIKDDGGGINVEKIWTKAVSQKIVNESERHLYDNSRLYKLLFLDDFSTSELVNEIAGRGIGLNVVADEVAKLGGEIEVSSAINEGTTFSFKLPIIREVL